MDNGGVRADGADAEAAVEVGIGGDGSRAGEAVVRAACVVGAAVMQRLAREESKRSRPNPRGVTANPRGIAANPRGITADPRGTELT